MKTIWLRRTNSLKHTLDSDQLIEKYIPKGQRDRVLSIEPDGDLIGGCRYLLYYNNGWSYEDGSITIPCVSIQEVKEYVRNAVKEA